jgi:hypothetical protein
LICCAWLSLIQSTIEQFPVIRRSLSADPNQGVMSAQDFLLPKFLGRFTHDFLQGRLQRFGCLGRVEAIVTKRGHAHGDERDRKSNLG